jgi:hypothetical protein
MVAAELGFDSLAEARAVDNRLSCRFELQRRPITGKRAADPTKVFSLD